MELLKCKSCGSIKLYILSTEIVRRKWRQKTDIEKADDILWQFVISSSDPDFARNEEVTRKASHLFCEKCGHDNTIEYKDFLKEYDKRLKE